MDVFIFRQKEQKKHIFQILLFSEFHHKLQLTFAGKEIPTLPQRITSKGTKKRTKLRSDFAPKEAPKQKNGSKSKEAKTPHSDFAKGEERQPPKIPSSVSDRKAEKQSTAKRSAGCLSEASSCASDERSFAAGSKLQTAVFLFVTFFFLPPKRKSKNKPKEKVRARANNKQNR